MSLPMYKTRPNESNPTILKTLQFLAQANVLWSKNHLNENQRKALNTKVEEMVQLLNRRYELDEVEKEEKSIDESAGHNVIEFMENQKVLEEISEKIAETRLEINANYSAIRFLNGNIERIKSQIRENSERNEKRKLAVSRDYEKMKKDFEIIRENLENSTTASELRCLEVKKQLIEKTLEELKNDEARALEKIKAMKATVKAERKQSFEKLVVEIAKQYRSYNVLLPKLERSRKNVEKLKVEEAARKASGSLDDTIVFDASFIRATQDNNTSQNSTLNMSNAKIPAPSTKAVIPQVPVITTRETTEPLNSSMRSISSNTSVQQLPPRELDVSTKQNQEEPMDQSNLEEQEHLSSKNTTLQEDPQPIEEDSVVEEIEEDTVVVADNINEPDGSPPLEMEVAAEDHNNDQVENPEQEKQKEVHNTSNRGSIGKNTSGFFDDLLAAKSTSGKEKKKDITDTIMDISMSSIDGGADLLQEMQNREEDDAHSQGSQSNNFSFNIFNAAGSTTNNESNFDFDFGGTGNGSGSENDGNFNFFGGGDTSANGSPPQNSDPFGFGKTTNSDNNDFNFNFDDAGSSNGGGNSSFFNF